jgi:hypothetical protein
MPWFSRRFPTGSPDSRIAGNEPNPVAGALVILQASVPVMLMLGFTAQHNAANAFS